MQDVPAGYKKISSRATIFHKWILRIFAIAFAVGAVDFLMEDGVPIDKRVFNASVFLGFTILFSAISFVVNLHLVDALYRSGDHLLGFRNGLSDHIEISNIESIKYTPAFKSPAYVDIRLKQAGLWGTKIRFIPVDPISDASWIPVVVKELDKRVKELAGKA